jgi:peptide deformylase
MLVSCAKRWDEMPNIADFPRRPSEDCACRFADRSDRNKAPTEVLDLERLSPYLHAMAIRPILETPDPRLRTISTPVEAIDDDLQTLIDDMFETMYDAPGIGLAAIQVGVPKRVLVIDLQEPETDEEGAEPVKRPMVFINPQIVDASPELSVYNEGCLSVPDQYAEVERPARIRASWMDRQGRIHEEELDELLSTCLQHEMDHLEGILFIDHLSRLKRDMLLKKLAKSRKAA